MLKSLFVFTCLCVTGLLQADDTPASSLHARDGLPNTALKLLKKEPLCIAFLGGSITRGGGQHGYVHQVGTWFTESFPDSEITVINAGASGTDSKFGAKRLDRDVLVHKPDLLLVEFAVNDGNRDHSEHMERILRKAWTANPNMDVLIFYTLAKKMLPDYAAGRLPPSAKAHERVAAHYGVPTLGLAHDVAGKIQRGEIQWENFANDSCHPHKDGYALFNESFRTHLPSLLAEANKALPRSLPDPLTADLVLYPEPLQREALKVPPFEDPKHGKATRSFILPDVGVHWLGDHAYGGEDGKTLWRLQYLPKRTRQPMDASLARKKSDWSHTQASWFEEDASFTGSNSYPVFQKQRQALRWNNEDAGVLVFVAPESGTYRYRLSTAGYLKGWRMDDTQALMNVLHFAWGEEEGEVLHTLHTPMRERGAPVLKLSGERKLVAGEELVFAINSDAPGYIRGGFEEMELEIGFYP